MLQSGHYDSLDDLETDMEYAHSSLLYLLLQAIWLHEENVQFAASHLGVSRGLVTLLRAIPHHSSVVSLLHPLVGLVKR